jgi:hypothetical protein
MTDSQYQILKIAVELAVTAQLRGDRIDRITAIDDTLKNMSNKENVLSFKLASPCNACIYCNSEAQFNINI